MAKSEAQIKFENELEDAGMKELARKAIEQTRR